jgi:hypothetical protein
MRRGVGWQMADASSQVQVNWTIYLLFFSADFVNNYRKWIWVGQYKNQNLTFWLKCTFFLALFVRLVDKKKLGQKWQLFKSKFGKFASFNSGLRTNRLTTIWWHKTKMPRVTLTNIKSNFRFHPFSIPFLNPHNLQKHVGKGKSTYTGWFTYPVH